MGDAAAGRDATATTCSPFTARASIRPRSRSTASIRITRCARRFPRREALHAAVPRSRAAQSATRDCTRAMLVGHNASFDLGFPECRGGAHRHQAQSRSTRSRASTPRRSAAWRSARRCSHAPRSAAGLDVGPRGSAFGDLRRRAHGGAVLHRLQPVPCAVRGIDRQPAAMAHGSTRWRCGRGRAAARTALRPGGRAAASGRGARVPEQLLRARPAGTSPG